MDAARSRCTMLSSLYMFYVGIARATPVHRAWITTGRIVFKPIAMRHKSTAGHEYPSLRTHAWGAWP